jgi:hypothetical protein
VIPSPTQREHSPQTHAQTVTGVRRPRLFALDHVPLALCCQLSTWGDLARRAHVVRAGASNEILGLSWLGRAHLSTKLTV